MPKVFVLFPDGVGLRNFAFTNFKDIGEQLGFEVVYWNNSVFPLDETFGFPEVKIENTRIHKKTATLNRARKRAELRWNKKRLQDPIYDTYRFPLRWNSLKQIFKSFVVKYHEIYSSHVKGLQTLKNQIYTAERSTARYEACKAQLEEHNPDLIFCTTQRATQGIAPILAAQDLGIKTATWIYSWDNLPKGMSTIETDFYFVWSELMKEELLRYYPKTRADQIFVTGTPQFEPHCDRSLIESREVFLGRYNLSPQKTYICFSGDDETTSPLDQHYLEDVAKAVKALNAEGYDLGIIFRKVPTDVSGRYNEVLKAHQDNITAIDPLWEPMGDQWHQMMPTKADFKLLVNTCHHCELVVNICSSMIFDFAIHGKPCIYPNYEQPQLTAGTRDIGQNYKYVHFRTLPNNAVVWALSKTEIYTGIKSLLDGKVNPVPIAQEWFKTINKNPIKDASINIWNAINSLSY